MSVSMCVSRERESLVEKGIRGQSIMGQKKVLQIIKDFKIKCYNFLS